MSIDYSHQSTLIVHAICLGPEVIEVRAHHATGRVIALLRNAIYLESGDGRIISIVDGEIDGPLTLRVANIKPLLARLKAPPCETFHATKDALCMEGVVRIAWAHSPHWTPNLPERIGQPTSQQDAVNVLAKAITQADRLEGLGQLAAHIVGARHAVPPPQVTHLDPLASRALATLNHACEAASTCNYAEVCVALNDLIGLGPGLTPSGDDMVAGIVAALVWQARIGCVPAELTRQVVEIVREAAPTRTNRISARLLWYACEGVLYATAMGLGEALLSGDTAATLAWSRRLFAIGHTTGVDLSIGLLTGMLLGIGTQDGCKVRYR
jgi:hypothetical protein